MHLRSSEWLIIAYFTYVALIAPFFIQQGEIRWLAAAVAGVAAAIIIGLSRTKWLLRDWAPLGFTLAAYRQMDWFTPAVHDHHLENSWIVWDRWLLDTAHLRAAIESLGSLFPSFLEICYALVYAAAPAAVLILMFRRLRHRIDIFWIAYLAGTLGAYALFPYFPSEPPRTAFPAADLPHIITVFRQFNLWIVGGYGIHSSVFPSAHVSSTFATAWGLLAAIPERKQIGWLFATYGLSVSIATIYGRYHYAVDAIAGIAISLLALVALRVICKPRVI